MTMKIKYKAYKMIQTKNTIYLNLIMKKYKNFKGIINIY